MVETKVMVRRTQLGLVCAVMAVSGAWVTAQVTPQQPASVLPGRPDETPGERLGEFYESRVAGIGLRPPVGSKVLHRAGSADTIVEFVDDAHGWVVNLSRIELSPPSALEAYVDDKGTKRDGLLADSVSNFKAANPVATVLRQEATKVAGYEMGLLAYRYSPAASQGSGRRLLQQALIPFQQTAAQNKSKYYYAISLTSLGAKSDTQTAPDPSEQEAVSLFSEMLDSVRLLDQGTIRQDQEQRLFRTRSLLIALKDPKCVQKAIVPEQWLRLLRDGQDIGYQYVSEETTRLDGHNGVQISTRSHTTPQAGVVVDVVSRKFISNDWRYETWTNTVTTRNGKANPVTMSDFGISERIEARIADATLTEGERLKDGSIDAKQPGLRETSQYRMEVRSQAGKTISKPRIIEQLPPWYLPQAIVHLLPRMLPKEPKSYMFSTYVSERAELMTRYTEVEAPRQVSIAGTRTLAVVVKDRVGLEGVVTSYYVSPEGKYLGNEMTVEIDGKKSLIQVVPSDKATLEKMWSDAHLTRPEDNEMPSLPTKR